MKDRFVRVFLRKFICQTFIGIRQDRLWKLGTSVRLLGSNDLQWKVHKFGNALFLQNPPLDLSSLHYEHLPAWSDAATLANPADDMNPIYPLYSLSRPPKSPALTAPRTSTPLVQPVHVQCSQTPQPSRHSSSYQLTQLPEREATPAQTPAAAMLVAGAAYGDVFTPMFSLPRRRPLAPSDSRGEVPLCDAGHRGCDSRQGQAQPDYSAMECAAVSGPDSAAVDDRLTSPPPSSTFRTPKARTRAGLPCPPAHPPARYIARRVSTDIDNVDGGVPSIAVPLSHRLRRSLSESSAEQQQGKFPCY